MKLKILFVSSGNSKDGISPIVKNQGESIKKQDIDLEYYTIKGKGVKGYVKAIFKLRKHLKNNSYDIVHAHYSLSAFVASLAGATPLIVSLMGSDVKANYWIKFIIYIFDFLSWSSIIVKSEDMKLSLGIKKSKVIPNGINMDRFIPMNQTLAQKKLNWDNSKKHILFAGNSSRKVKNFQLAKKSFDLLNNKNMELHTLTDIPNEDMPYYYNATDVVILTSLWEGSPNVIKEAMACNRPIVSVNVGDVEKILNNIEGCYITKHDSQEISQKIKKSLTYNSTKSRNKISYLNEEIIAKKLIKIYKLQGNK